MTTMAPRFRGRTAAQRRLESFHRADGSRLVVGKIMLVRHHPPVWQAETSDGTRWVCRTSAGTWVVSKEEPGQ